MSDLEHLRTQNGGRRRLIPGVIALVLGIVGVIVYIVLATGETPGAATGQGALQGVLIVVSAALVGAGALLVATGALKHRRRTRGIEADDDQARTLN
jgi:hypothetical protein